jgi:drug/metabolite transporter (DMT)-like permease
MHGHHRLEQESSSGGNGTGMPFRRESEEGEEISDFEIELKQHGSPTGRFEINSNSSWGSRERSLLRMVERNKTSRVFDCIKQFKSKGLILAMFAVILELVMWIMLKKSMTEKIPFDIFYLRAFTNMAGSFICAKLLKIDMLGIEHSQRPNIRTLIVASFLATGLSFVSYMINDVTIAAILIYTSILFTSIFAFFKFGEKIDRYDAVNVVISIISVLLIMNFFDKEKQRPMEIIIGLLGAMFLGLCFVIVKDLDDSIDFLSLTFYESIGMCAFGPTAYFVLGRYFPAFAPSIE